MALFSFSYINTKGEAIPVLVDLDSTDASLNPYIKHQELAAELEAHRALAKDGEVGGRPDQIFAYGAQGEFLREALVDLDLLIIDLEVIKDQQSNAEFDARTASTEEEREIIKHRALFSEEVRVLCDDFTPRGPCQNTPMAGDTKCGPHRAKANREAAMPVQQQLDVITDDFIVGVTGPRELQKATPAQKEALLAYLRYRFSEAKAKYGDRLVIMCGMAEGFDKACAIIAIELGIRLWCVIPNKGYAGYYWQRRTLAGRNMLPQFEQITDAAWEVTYVMEDIVQATGVGVYYNAETNSLSWKASEGRHANMVRNDYMVENCDAFLVYDPSSPGTRDAFASIRRANKPYELVPTL